MMERQHVQATSNPTTWSQWGKAAVVFTVTTGAYAISKAVGMVWRGHTNQTHPLDNKENNAHCYLNEIGNFYAMAHQHAEEVVSTVSPLITISTLLVSAPQYSWILLSAVGFSLLEQIQLAEAAFPARFDLANLTDSEGFILQGTAADDYTGVSISAAGDVNGDGLDDVLVGAYQADPLGRSNAGAAYLLFGSNSSWPAVVDLGNLTASLGVVLQGALADDWTGRSVSAAGDVNGDGLADVLVGAHQADPLGRSNAGVAYLLFGRNSSWPAVIDLANFNASLGVVLQGSAVSDNTGISVSAVGDVNGDNITDMLVGARYADPLGRDSAGVVYLLFGRNSSWPAVLDLGSLTPSLGVLLQGAAAGDRTGVSVSAAGDVNSDGLADMLVGAYYADPLGRSNAGVVYLLFGRNGSWPAVVDLGNLTPSFGVVLQGAAADDQTGRSVSAAGDVNGDGLADVLVGAFETDPLNRTDAGVAYVIFGQGSTLPNSTLPQTSNTTPSPASLAQTPSSSTALAFSTTTALSSQAALNSAQPLRSNTGAITQNNPGFSIYSNSILYAEIGIEVIITTDNLSVEGFIGDSNQLIFSIPENSAYTVTVNGEEQNSFPLWAIQQGFVGLTLGDDFCFEDFNEISVQATDGRSTADFNLVFQGETASCILNGASTLNARASQQGVAMLLVGSGLGFLASRQRDKSTVKNAATDCQKNKSEEGFKRVLST